MALTQLIGVGALDAYLTAEATFSYWKSRYQRYCNFACESYAQPFSSVVSFGSEAQVVLNRQGDLIYHIYVVLELPGIMAVDTDANPEFGGQSFPAYMEQSCAPCARSDEKVFRNFADSEDAGDSASEVAAKLRTAKNKYLKATYGHAPGLECGDEVEDCPDALCPELGGVWCHWVNGIGQWLLKNVKVIIGGSTVDQLWSEYLFMWEELSGKAGRRLNEMIGKRYTRTQLVVDSRNARTLFVPLPLWFSEHSGNALSLASLQFHGVSLHVNFAPLQQCIVTSGSNVSVKNARTGQALNNGDLKAYLETTFVFLENQERERFATSQFEVLITQHQSFYMQATGSQPRIQLNFNHPTSELLIALRRSCHEKTNNWFCFSGIDNRDPLMYADLLLNNQSRFGRKSAQYLRCVVPYETHTNIPDAFVYVMSFSLDPESASPAGSCNLSRVDNVDLTMELQPDIVGSGEYVTVICFARSYNILRFREGLGGLAFAS